MHARRVEEKEIARARARTLLWLAGGGGGAAGGGTRHHTRVAHTDTHDSFLSVHTHTHRCSSVTRRTVPVSLASTLRRAPASPSSSPTGKKRRTTDRQRQIDGQTARQTGSHRQTDHGGPYCPRSHTLTLTHSHPLSPTLVFPFFFPRRLPLVVSIISTVDNEHWRRQRDQLVPAFLPLSSLRKIFTISVDRASVCAVRGKESRGGGGSRGVGGWGSAVLRCVCVCACCTCGKSQACCGSSCLSVVLHLSFLMCPPASLSFSFSASLSPSPMSVSHSGSWPRWRRTRGTGLWT